MILHNKDSIKKFVSSTIFTRGIAPAQVWGCGQSSFFISLFARVIVVVNFVFWVDHCFSSFLLL